jgi:hypothetical protein
VNELHELAAHVLVAAIQDDLASAHRSLSEAVYKLAYNRSDEELIERQRHLQDRIGLLGTALASAQHAQNHESMKRCAAAIQDHIDRTQSQEAGESS